MENNLLQLKIQWESSSIGGLKPVSSNLRSEPWIVAALATATLDDDRDWMELVNNYDNIRTLMSNALSGFENYNERVRNPEGLRAKSTKGFENILNAR